MKSENQIENQMVIETETPLVVDLNRATAEELEAIPGIGPTLAERIVTYRDTVHPFEEPVEITAVPGISEKTYRAIADHLTVAPTEPLPMRGVDPDGTMPPPVEIAVEALSPLEEPPLEEEMAPEAEAEASEEAIEVIFPPPTELPLEEEGAPEAEVELAEEATEAILSPLEELSPTEEMAPETEAEAPEPPLPAPFQIAPVPAPSAPRRSGLAWLGSALLGGLLGMVFTLLVLSGINGSLDIDHSQAVLKVKNQMNSLTAEMDSLQGEIGGLRQRLDGLEGLTARMERAELAVDDLHGEMAALEQQAGALKDQVNVISEDLAAIQGQTQQMETFFQRLQALLNELFGEAEGTLTPTPTPSP